MNIDAGYIRVMVPSSHQDMAKPLTESLAPPQDLSPQQVVQGSSSMSAEMGTDTGEQGKEQAGTGEKEDKVSISQEAMEKQAEESGAVGEAGTSLADLTIEKLKEQIEAVEKQLERLSGREGMEEQVKMLQDELAILNAALVNAMNEKVQAMS